MTFISPPQTKNPGDEASFKCTVVKPKNVLIAWVKDGKSLTLGNLLAFNNPRFNIDVDDATNTYTLTVSES